VQYEPSFVATRYEASEGAFEGVMNEMVHPELSPLGVMVMELIFTTGTDSLANAVLGDAIKRPIASVPVRVSR
jgi:hypothetical protein